MEIVSDVWSALPETYKVGARSVLPRVAELLPDDVTTLYFEVHFTDKRAGCLRDLLAHVSLVSGGDLPRGPIGTTASKLRSWYGTSGLAPRCLPSTWIELDDVLRTGAEASIPGVSLCVDPAFDPIHPPTCGPKGLPVQILSALAAELYETLAETRPTCNALEAVVRSWPETGRVRHLSIMAGRRIPVQKLYGLFPVGELAPFLANVRFPGDGAVAVDLAGSLHEASSNVHVDLTTTEVLAPRLALEFFSEPAPYHDFFRKKLLREAESRGLIDSAGIRALCSWVGIGFHHSGEVVLQTVRWFDLKFVIDGDRPSLKAYLGVRIQPVSV